MGAPASVEMAGFALVGLHGREDPERILLNHHSNLQDAFQTPSAHTALHSHFFSPGKKSLGMLAVEMVLTGDLGTEVGVEIGGGAQNRETVENHDPQCETADIGAPIL